MKCKSKKTVEDEVCITVFPCELEKGHKSMHVATYPGLEDFDKPSKIYWDESKERMQVRKRDYRIYE